MRPQDNTITREFWVMMRLLEMPFASASDLAGLGEYSMSQCRKTLDVLERRGDVSWSQRGATVRKQARYLLTSQGVQKVFDQTGESPGWYTVEAGAWDLAQRMPMVGQFYKILPKLKAAAGDQAAVEPGRVTGNPLLVRFIWLRHDSYHAIVEFQNGRLVRAYLGWHLVHRRGAQTEVERPPHGEPGTSSLDRMGHR